MIVEVYLRKGERLAPELYENHKKGIYQTFDGVESIVDVGFDFDVKQGNKILGRFDKSRFYFKMK